MARIRTIKPEFWTDERVGESSVSARLLFLACLNFADDHGGLDRSSKQLKAQAFPYDSIDCEPLVQELITVGLLLEYEVDGKKYLHIKGFREHQRVEKPARPRVPLYEHSGSSRGGLTDYSPSPHLGVTVSSLEGKGSYKRDATRRPAKDPYPPEFEQIRRAYPRRSGSNPWPKALQAVRARLAEGVGWAELLAGVNRYAEFVRATHKDGTELVQQASRFFGPGREFENDWSLPIEQGTAGQAKGGWQ